jgi:hypothetical protein
MKPPKNKNVPKLDVLSLAFPKAAVSNPLGPANSSANGDGLFANSSQGTSRASIPPLPLPVWQILSIMAHGPCSEKSWILETFFKHFLHL